MRGFLEVETPIRMPEIAPEQYISPFDSEGWFLCTSPELHMKRLLASGYDNLFQITRCFRKGETGKQHNPEFSMLEWYRIGGSYRDMITDTEEMITAIYQGLGIGPVIQFLGKNVDLSPPWTRMSIQNIFRKTASWDPIATPDPERFDVDLTTKIMPSLDFMHPIVLEYYPASMASLSRLNSNDPRVSERAEVFIAGLELANAYSELNDPTEQQKRFEKEIALINEAGGKASMPDRFVKAMAQLPECSGIALGLDRLVMLFSGTDSIEDVMTFPAHFI